MSLKKHPLLYTWFAAFVNAFIPIFLIPFAYKNLGTNEYTLYLYLTMLMNLSFMADVGFTSTITRFYSYAELGHDGEVYNKGSLFQASHFFYSILGFLGVLLFFGFMLFSGQGVLSGLDQNVKISSSVLFGLIIFIRFNGFKYTSLLNGTDHIQKTKLNELISSLVLLSVGMFSLIYFKKLEIFIASQVIGYFVNFLLNKYTVSKFDLIQKDRKWDFLEFKKNLKLIWVPSFKVGIVALASVLTANSINIVIGRMDDKNLVAQYLLSIRLFTFVISFLSLSIMSFYPVIVSWLVARKKTELRRLLVGVVSFSLTVFLLAFAGIFVLSMNFNFLNFLSLNLLPVKLILILACIFLIELHQSLHANFYIQTNDVPFVIPMTITALIILSICYFLAPQNKLLEMLTVQLIISAAWNSWYSVKMNLALLDFKFRDYLIGVLRSISNLSFFRIMFERNSL